MPPDPAETLPGSTLAVVVVTYNRCDDLQQLLQRLAEMQADFDYLVVVNNASTDGTDSVIDDIRGTFGDRLITRNMPENTGGAGGFHEGVKIASGLPVDWIWLSDDDAMPRLDCFSRLKAAATRRDAAYGSVALVKDSPGGELCWPARCASKRAGSPAMARYVSELEDLREVSMLPFLGFLVSREKVLEVGLPNERYFISGDDMQYSIRLRQAGTRMFLVRDSVVLHPSIPRYSVKVFGRRIDCLRMPPWRRKLDIRNRVWNGRLSSGIPGALYTAIALSPRIIFTLFHERPARGQLGAYLGGLYSGLFEYGKSGNRSPRPD